MAYQFKQIKRNKYKNRKCEFDGLTFASAKEMRRYKQLKAWQELGLISDLSLQQKFVLIPAQRIEGKLIERECAYVADFMYTDNETGKTVVEDVKGYRKANDSAYRIFRIKQKLMYDRFGIWIKEV